MPTKSVSVKVSGSARTSRENMKVSARAKGVSVNARDKGCECERASQEGECECERTSQEGQCEHAQSKRVSQRVSVSTGPKRVCVSTREQEGEPRG